MLKIATASFALSLSLGSLRAADPLTAVEMPGLFGISPSHVNNRSEEDAARWVPQMQAIGLRYYRAAATGWPLVEPQQGQWTWEALDRQMAFLESHGVVFGGLLLGSPRWNTQDRSGSLPVNNLPAWSAYVTALVSHAKGHIRSGKYGTSRPTLRATIRRRRTTPGSWRAPTRPPRRQTLPAGSDSRPSPHTSTIWRR